MQDNGLHKLGKTDLLTIIYEQEKQIEQLTKEVEELKQQLEDRTIKIKEAGSIAEASMRLNKIFEAAQQAADEYLESIKEVNKPSHEYAEINENITNEKPTKETNQDKNFKNKNTDEKLTYDKKDDIDKIVRDLIVINTSLSVIKPKLIKRILMFFKQFIILKLKTKNRLTHKKMLEESKEIVKATKETAKNALITTKNQLITFKVHILKLIKDFLIQTFVKIKEFVLIAFFAIKNHIYGFIEYCKEQYTIQKEKTKSKIDISDLKISLQDLEKELKRRKEKAQKISLAKTLTYSIMVIVAFAIITSTSCFKILQVSGNSMEPTLNAGELLITSKFFKYEKGDMIAFYYNDSVLIKRVIATAGDTVLIDDNGEVYVNSVKLEENYVKKLSYEKCDIEFPYQVPENSVFILGDNREVSIDSRSKSIGCISKDKIIGKIQFKLNPFVIY